MLENFMDYFRRQIDIINSLSCSPCKTSGLTGSENVTLYKKIAYVSFLDYLSSIRFYRAAYAQLFNDNNKRFKRFLEECSGWDVGGLICLNFLRDKLTKASKDGRLFKYINEKLSNLGDEFDNTVCVGDVDESPAKLLPLASNEAEEVAIFHCQHYSIMYRYRNNLVHQARRPGRALEYIGQDQTEACYYTYAGDSAIYLLYPLGLFKILCENSLEKLGIYLKKNKLDPYQLENNPRCF